MQAILNTTATAAYIGFIAIAVTGPIIGVIIGGFVFSRIGGYTNPKSLPVALLATMFAASCGIP